jgi:hypothetical protein
MTFGGICWYCYWGWARPVKEIYERAVEELGDSVVDYGPGHIVFADENFENHNIEFCLNECDANRDSYRDRMSDAEIDRLRAYLVELRQVPEEVRCCAPEEYWKDADHPERYPPTIEVVK